MITFYRQFRIYEEHEHLWSTTAVGEALLPSGKRIAFSSGLENNDVFEFDEAVESVKNQINKFYHDMQTPHKADFPLWRMETVFFYKGFDMTLWTDEEIAEEVKEYASASNWNDVSVQVDHRSWWTAHIKDGEIVEEDITIAEKIERIITIRIYGTINDCNFIIKYTHKKPYIEIYVPNEDCESVADEIAKTIGAYDSKEFVKNEL